MDHYRDLYRREWQRMLQKPWKHPSFISKLRDYKTWKASLISKKSPVQDKIPWLTFPAIRFLDKILNKKMSVFEYGSGGSTLFFAKRVCHVVSVEHDSNWAREVNCHLKQNGFNDAEVHFVPPRYSAGLEGRDPSDPTCFFSGSEPYLDYDFCDYVRFIERFEDASLDLVLIDGRARPACFQVALCKVKVGGYICLDNTERDRYARAMQIVERDFKFYDFPGPTPYAEGFTRTSFWKRIE